MKKLKCKSCSKVWYIDDRELNNQKGCPFCLSEIAKEIKFDTMDTLAKVIYDAIMRYGIDILKNPNKLLGYIMDISPNLKKEMRLLSRVLGDYNKEIWELFHADISNIESFLKDIRMRLVDYDEMSERGAKMVCDNLSSAVMFYKGENLPVVMSVEVSDVSVFSEEKTKVEVKKPIDEQYVKYSGRCGEQAYWKLLKDGTFIIEGQGNMYDYNKGTDTDWCKYRYEIKKVEIRNGITSIGSYAFGYCSSLQSVSLPESLMRIREYGFNGCNSLEEVSLPENLLKLYEYAFNNCSSLKKIMIPQKLKQRMFNWDWKKGCDAKIIYV